MPVSRSISSLSLIRLRLLRPRSRAQGGTLAPRFYPAFGRTCSLKTHRLPGWGKVSIRSPRLRYGRVSCSLRPLRLRPLLRLAVHFQIHLLMEEAQITFYVGGRRYRIRIVPDKCFPSLTAGLYRVVRRHPLVGTLRFLVAREEHVLRDIFWAEVVARRQPGLEEDLGTLGLCYDLPVDADLDVPGALQHVHSMVRVAGVYEDFLVFFIPMVHHTPIEGQVTCNRRGGVYRLRVAPHGVLCDPIPGPHGPVRGVALERAVGSMVALLEQLHPHVLDREVVDG